MIRQLLLILRFYYSAMFFFCAAVSVALAWLVKVHGPEIIPMCMLGKAAVYPLYLYVWIVQRYGDEFFYYRNLGVRRRELLGVSCAADFVLCYVLLKLTALFLYEPSKSTRSNCRSATGVSFRASIWRSRRAASLPFWAATAAARAV